MAKPWRPSIDDVDSISRGGPAKVRGTGSRNIPHRLNAEERSLYDLAKKKGFLAVRGTGYRKFRHGNPLPNIFRQWCDARAQLCVVVEQDPEGRSGVDRLVLDLAPLRLEDTCQVEAVLSGLAAELGVRRVGYDERPEDALPFNILPPEDEHGGDEGDGAHQHRLFTPSVKGSSSSSTGGSTAGGASVKDEARHEATSAARDAGGSGGGGGGGTGTDGVASTSGRGAAAAGAAEVAALQEAVAVQAAVVRRLKEAEGRSNRDEAVQKQVQQLLQLKARLQHAAAAQEQLQSSEGHRSEHASNGIHACSRSSAREAAEAADVEELQEHAHGTTGASAAATMPSPTAPQSSPSAAAPAAPVITRPAAGGAVGPAPRRSPLSHYYKLPIWQIHSVPMFFEAERPLAKEFAGEAVKRVAEALAAMARR